MGHLTSKVVPRRHVRTCLWLKDACVEVSVEVKLLWTGSQDCITHDLFSVMVIHIPLMLSQTTSFLCLKCEPPYPQNSLLSCPFHAHAHLGLVLKSWNFRLSCICSARAEWLFALSCVLNPSTLHCTAHHTNIYQTSCIRLKSFSLPWLGRLSWKCESISRFIIY